jgi:hypothetical protein
MIVKLSVIRRISFILIFVLLIGVGVGFLIVSFLCFLYIIPGFWSCGSPCEYWWSWLIDFPRSEECAAVCVSRNSLYKPFFLIGLVVIASTILVGLYYLYQRIRE